MGKEIRALSSSSTACSSSDPSDGWSSEPVTYHYLAFDTPLPPPSTKVPPSASAPTAPPPPPPDLRAFDDPLSWPGRRKSLMLWLSVLATVFTGYAPGAYAAGVAQIGAEWGLSRVVALVGLPIFNYGFAAAPMALAPFSELNGRRPVFVVAGVVYFACLVACAATPTYSGMLLARFFAGCASSTFSTMVGGVVADIYPAADRNTPMALFTGGVVFGTGLGPLLSGFVAQNAGWRWIFWTQGIIVGLMMLFLIAFFAETRGTVLLSRRARALNRWYDEREAAGFFGVEVRLAGVAGPVRQRIRWKVKADEERQSLVQMIALSTYRPFHLLLTEPVVFFFSLWISFSWAILFMTFGAIPYVFTAIYAFSPEQAGAVFASIIVAGIIATGLSIYQEKLARSLGKLSPTPEARLYFSCFESVLMPIGLFWFGWTSVPSIPWIVPTLALGCATLGIFSIYLATFNYLADSYGPYASSAIAAQSFCRNLLGGSFPLFTQQMFERLTIGGATSLLGGLGALLTLVPWILALHGPRIRARSKIASQIMSTAPDGVELSAR